MNNRTKAAAYMMIATLSLSLVPLCVKLIPASSGIPLSEKLLARSVISMLVMLAFMSKKKAVSIPVSYKLMGLRCIFGIGGLITYFSAVQRMPLAEIVTINRMSPFFVAIFSWIFLREKLSKLQIAAIFIGFSGVLFILRPERIPVGTTALLAVSSAFFAGSAYTTLRALRKTDSPLSIVFWFSVVMTIVFLPKTILRGVIPDRNSLFLLIGIGVFGAIGQLLMTMAYRCAKGGEVAIYSYLSVLFAIVWQIAFFGNLPHNGVFIGGGLVITGGYLNYRFGIIQRRKSPDNTDDAEPGC